VFNPAGAANTNGANLHFSVMTWFKGNPADSQARFQNIMGHRDASWRLTMDTQGLNRFNPGPGPELQWPTAFAGAANGFVVNDGAWHFVAAVLDNTNEYLYVDGRVSQTNTPSTPVTNTITGSGNDLVLGGDPQ